MHLVGFTIEIYYDARPCERQAFVTYVPPRRFDLYKIIVMGDIQRYTSNCLSEVSVSN